MSRDDVQIDLREPTPLVARRIALALLDDARAAARRYRRGKRTDAKRLHEFRVTIRRLRGWLQLWHDALSDTVSRKQVRGIRRIARATTPASDLEAQLKWLRKQQGDDDDSDRRRVKAVRTSLKAQRHHVHSVARDATRDLEKRSARLRRRLEVYAVQVGEAEMDDVRFGVALATVIKEASTALQSALGAIHSERANEAIHAARIAAKRLRYLLEPVAGSARGAQSVIDELASLQDLSGVLHDADVFRGVLRRQHGHRAAIRFLTGVLADMSAADFATLEERWLGRRADDFFARVQRVAKACERGAASR